MMDLLFHVYKEESFIFHSSITIILSQIIGLMYVFGGLELWTGLKGMVF